MRRWQEFIGGREPTPELVASFRDTLEASHANSTAVRTFGTVRAYYSFIDRPSPFSKVKAPSRISNWTPEVPEDEQVERLWRSISSVRDRAVVSLLLNGLRAQEVCDLDYESLRFEAAYNKWVLRVVGKKRRMRLVPLNKRATSAVLAYISDTSMQRKDDPLLYGRNAERLTVRQVAYIVDKWQRASGTEGLHPHAFRHHYATRLARSKVDVLVLQKLMGHTRPETTSVYVTLDMTSIIEASNDDPLDGEAERKLQVVA